MTTSSYESGAPKQYQNTMPRLGLELNSRVKVKLNPMSPKDPQLQGEFIGICHYEFLIIRIPSIPGLINKLLPHTRVEVQYIADGAVNTFHTEIISHSVRPCLLLYTTYPDRMSIMETRKHRRVTCALPFIANTLRGDGKGVICDLSMGGCRVALELAGQSGMRDLEIDDKILLQVAMSADGVIQNCIAAVRNIDIAGGRAILGLSFIDTTEEFLKGLSEYIHTVNTVVP